jgi:hypothetical protein
MAAYLDFYGQELMSKQLIIESKSGINNIEKSRRATNISNLIEDKKKWKIISNLEDEKVSDNDLKNIISTLYSRLKTNYQFHGFTNEDDISFKDIKKLANDYLKCPESIQISLCRNSTRQAIDETVQYETLKKYIKNFEVVNLPSGLYTLKDGNISQTVSSVGEARSIDVKIFDLSYNYIAWGFLKYSRADGSIQTQQSSEAISFLEQAKIYCSKHKDNTIFFIQLDGISGEKHIPYFKEKCKPFEDRILVGNTEDIIDYFNNNLVV